jgi:hypothetical protein
MGRTMLAMVAAATLAACASTNESTEAAARAECEAQGLPEGVLLSQCIARMEEAVRIARENGGAPPQPRNPGQPR